jgi:hypothetical protein
MCGCRRDKRYQETSLSLGIGENFSQFLAVFTAITQGTIFADIPEQISCKKGNENAALKELHDDE